MKILGKILLVLVILIVVVVLARNQITRMAVGAGVKVATGLEANVGRADVGIFKTSIGFYDLVIHNPSKYKERNFVTLPEIFVDYNLGDIMKNDIHLENVRVNLSELVVIKNADGSMNFKEIKTPPAQPEQKGSSGAKPPKVRIDKFSLKLGKVIYVDYSRGTEPKIKEYALNVDETFENITGAQDVIPLLTSKIFLTVQRILINSSISDLSNLGGVLKGSAGELLGQVEGLGKEMNTGKVKDSVGAVKDKLKGLFQ